MTPGEVMQLPSDEEIVMLSGSPPIRARKARYFEDRSLASRVGTPLAPSEPAEPRPHAWVQVVSSAAAPPDGDGGPSLEPGLSPGLDRAERDVGEGSDGIVGFMS
jgi:type IV secretion system protein VirD4